MLGKPSRNTAKSVSTNPIAASLASSPFFAAYELAKSLIDVNGDLDDHFWAKLIKCRILDLKKEVQTRMTPRAVTRSSRDRNVHSFASL
jgi:hypothetical protein